ncbi:MAG: xanthine dehydrogenase family protein molybdopterin-binding subunit [Candidatus Dormibacteraeota bacterium]|nr:xanthine dehydrogenase family protein molybdopterin-binding subunit [Candidatus Dormibacteraeota bacterium]
MIAGPVLGSILGHPVKRREDPRLVTGRGLYVDDVAAASDALHAVFVRSPHAHARLGAIDASEACARAGVITVDTAASLSLPARRGMGGVPRQMARPPLSVERVRYVGEPVAVVLAETRDAAVDAAAAVIVDYEPLPAVMDPVAAGQEGATLLYPDAHTNVCYRVGYGDVGDDVLAGADVIVRATFCNQRLAPVPMEPNAVVAEPDSDGLKLWVSSQGPFLVRDAVAESLGLDKEQVRVIAPDVGGGFGPKMTVYPEQVVVAALAHRFRRQVRWMETRTENLLNMAHGRGQVQELELGALRDGTMVGMRVRVTAEAGAYPLLGAWLPTFTGLMLAGVYRIPRIDYRAVSVVTNTTPTAAYRGAGRPEAATLVERAVNMLAGELGLDPAELRRRNFIDPEAFPLQTAAGADYDSGEYARALDRALEVAGYAELRREQAERRARGSGPLLGVGLATYVEVTGGGAPNEFGSVEVHADGRVTVLAGTSSHGQGHETTYAQLVAERLQVEPARIEVVHSDTGRVPRGGGTVGSRSMQMGGTAIHLAAVEVVDRARHLAARELEADQADVELADGVLRVRGVPASALTWAELATRAGADCLRADTDFKQVSRTFPFGAHLAVVEVDPETGSVSLRRHVAVDDCGTVLNPMIAEGQQHGGIAQGVAQALFEEVVYDAEGNPLTASLMDYTLPTANELPRFEALRTITPTPVNPLGVKGIGESGTIGSTPAVLNAVVDALSHLGVRDLDMPATPEKVWRAIAGAASLSR